MNSRTATNVGPSPLLTGDPAVVFDFDRSVTAAHFRATGWDVCDYNHSNPFECHHFYLCDFRTNHTQVFSVKQEDVRNQSTPTFFSMEMLASGIGQLMLDMAEQTSPGAGKQVWRGGCLLRQKHPGLSPVAVSSSSWRTLADDHQHLP